MNPSQSNLTAPLESIPGSVASRPAGSRLVKWTVVAFIFVSVAAVLGLIPRWRARAALRQEMAILAVPNVIVASPQPGKSTAGITLPAEVRPLIEAPIYARANGFLKRWLVDIGAKVEAGQVLAEIDTPELDQELARSRAESLQAEAALELSRISAARWADLLKTSSVSEQEAAEKQSDLALKSATLEGARANVRRLEELKSFARVTAPFAGIITTRRTDVGELIAAGSAKELFRLAQTSTLRVYARVPQSAVRSIVPGQLAQMTIPEVPGQNIPARIVRTSGAMDAQSRTLLVELEVDNTAGEILAGSYAQVVFPDPKTEAALTLPSNCLLFRAEGTQVGVVHPDGLVELRNIKLGRDFGPTVEVLDGVTTRDLVIINPADSLVAGTIVRIAASAPSAVSQGPEGAKRKSSQ